MTSSLIARASRGCPSQKPIRTPVGRLARRLLGVLGLGAILLAAGTAEAAPNPKYAGMVVDALTGRVIYAENADSRRYPASLTKIMTLYMLFDAIDRGQISMEQTLTVSRAAAAMPPSKLGLKPGTRISVKDAILSLVTKSANDIAVVVAEAIGGTESQFAQLMTKKARALGMSRTTFRNASGLPNSKQVTTARDMVTLARRMQADFPHYYPYFSTKSFRYRGTSYKNHNKLLGTYDGVDGIKTGYIRASGFNLVASATRQGRRLIAVVMGGRTSNRRNAHMADLLDRGFRNAARFGVSELVPPADRKPWGTASSTAAVSDVMLPTPRPSDLVFTTDAPAGTVIVAGTAGVRQSWGVQVGAFHDFAPAEIAARRAARSAGDLLDESRVLVDSVPDADGDSVYRARLIGVDESRARAACRQLAAQQTACLVIPPEVSG